MIDEKKPADAAATAAPDSAPIPPPIDVPQENMTVHGAYQDGQGIYWHTEHGMSPMELIPLPGDVVEHDDRLWWVGEYVTYVRLYPYPETKVMPPINKREFSSNLGSTPGHEDWGVADWVEAYSGQGE